MFYGGKRFEKNVEEIKNVLNNILPDYEYIMAVDIHSGVGQRYKMHMVEIPNLFNRLDRKLMDEIFDGFNLDGYDSSIHKETGSFLECILKSLDRNRKYIPVLIDFGTLDSESLSGALKSLRIIIEDQGRLNGYVLQSDKDKISEMYKNMFYPQDALWRVKVIESFDCAMKRIVKNFEELCK